MYCKYLSKSLNGNLRCKSLKTITYIDECKKCLKFEPRVNKPIKKVSNKYVLNFDINSNIIKSWLI